MSKIVSLFSDQKTAGKAVQSLTQAGLKDADTYTIEEWNSNLESKPIEPPIYTGQAATSVTIPPIRTVLPALDLDNEAERYLKRSLKEGGVLVLVEPSNAEESEKAREILKEAGGQVAL